MYDKMGLIGLKWVVPWDPNSLDPVIREAINKGAENTRAEMKKQSQVIADAGKLSGNRDAIRTENLQRAMGVYVVSSAISPVSPSICQSLRTPAATPSMAANGAARSPLRKASFPG